MKTCIITIVKNEQEYLEDFIKYHLDLGITDIFIWEDLGSESHKNITDKYENVHLSSILDLYEDERERFLIQCEREAQKPIKTKLLNKALQYIHSLGKYDWTFNIDNDEYITCTEPLEDVLGRYKDYDGVMLYWQNYGCSGHLYKPKYDKPIWEIYTEKAGYEVETDLQMGNICKFTINMKRYNPKMYWDLHNSKENWCKVDFSKDDRRRVVLGDFFLRHYITKSVEEWYKKLYIRGMFYRGHRNEKSLYDMCPEVKEQIKADKGFQRYMIEKYNILV